MLLLRDADFAVHGNPVHFICEICTRSNQQKLVLRLSQHYSHDLRRDPFCQFISNTRISGLLRLKCVFLLVVLLCAAGHQHDCLVQIHHFWVV